MTPDPKTQRVQLLRIAVEMLPLLLREGARWTLVENPLPADARFLRWFLEGPHQDLVIVVTSDLFPEVAEGQVIPDLLSTRFHEEATS